MNSRQLFSGRAYLFNGVKEIKDKKSSVYSLIISILKKSGINKKPSSIFLVGGDENEDHYELIIKKLVYILKISLDEDCKTLKNEISFFNNNDTLLTCQYINHGKIRLGSNILFLLTSRNIGDNINDLGSRFILDNPDSFFYALSCLSNLESNNNSINYISLIFDQFEASEEKPFLDLPKDNSIELDKIYSINKILKENILSKNPIQLLGGDFFCHGFLNRKSIDTKFGLFKFKNFGYSFKGNGLIDLAFLTLDFGFTNRDKIFMLKKYCEYHDLDFIENELRFKRVLEVASCIFLMSIAFKYLVETYAYKNSRPENIVDLSILYSKSFHIFQNIKCFPEIRENLESILTKPILE